MISSHVKYPWFLAAVAVFLLSVVVALSQNSPDRALLVASCGSEKQCGDVSVHRFVFRGGKLVAQEVVTKLVTDKGYFQGGENRIIKNRYAVSTTGAVLDLQTKEWHADEVGMLIGVDDSDLYINKLNFVNLSASSTYRLDLETKKYSRHSRPNFYSLFGERQDAISPDGRKAVQYDGISRGLFVLTKKGRNPSDFSSFRAATGYEATCSKCSSRITYSVPSVWIDNDRFLTQRENGHLVAFDYNTRKWTDVVKIPSAKNVSTPPVLFTDPAGGVYYDADKLYKIDVANRTYSETDTYDLGHGFTVSGRQDTKLFSFGDLKIASLISGRYVTTEGYLAAEFHESPLATSSPMGIRVWGKEVSSWTTIRIKYSPRIIGWLNG